MGSIIAHRIDYNGLGVLRGQRHIPSKHKSKPHYEIGARATTSEARKRKKQRKKGKKRKLGACENRRKRACRVFRSLGGAPLAKGIGILQLETVDCETLHLFTLTADKACLRAPRGRGELGYERDGDACRKC